MGDVPAQEPPLRERLEVLKELIALFRFERLVYLTITVVAFIALIACAVITLVRDQSDILQVSMLFGSSGAIGYTGGRLLRMWSDALRFLHQFVISSQRDAN